jgi:hypothetical protein
MLYPSDFFVAISFDAIGLLPVSALYLLQMHGVKQEQFEDIYHNSGRRFTARGDGNVERTDWGSSLITPKERELLKTMESNS